MASSEEFLTVADVATVFNLNPQTVRNSIYCRNSALDPLSGLLGYADSSREIPHWAGDFVIEGRHNPPPALGAVRDVGGRDRVGRIWRRMEVEGPAVTFWVGLGDRSVAGGWVRGADRLV